MNNLKWYKAKQSALLFPRPPRRGGGGGLPPPRFSPPDGRVRRIPRRPVTGQFWRPYRSPSLSLAKTGGKPFDWPGGVVTSHGPPLTQLGKSDWPSDGHVTRCIPIGREPPRCSSLNSALVRDRTHGDNGVGQSEVKVLLALMGV